MGKFSKQTIKPKQWDKKQVINPREWDFIPDPNHEPAPAADGGYGSAEWWDPEWENSGQASKGSGKADASGSAEYWSPEWQNSREAKASKGFGKAEKAEPKHRPKSRAEPKHRPKPHQPEHPPPINLWKPRKGSIRPIAKDEDYEVADGAKDDHEEDDEGQTRIMKRLMVEEAHEANDEDEEEDEDPNNPFDDDEPIRGNRNGVQGYWVRRWPRSLLQSRVTFLQNQNWKIGQILLDNGLIDSFDELY